MDKLIVGLTGNICTGKSYIANYLKLRNGIRVFDCDNIAKKILRNDNWSLNWLSDKLFIDDGFRENFQKYIHPKVWNYIQKEIDKDDHHDIFIVESAIIYEIGWNDKFHNIILAHCDENTQMNRILSKYPDRASSIMKYRLKCQLTLSDKLRLAHTDFIIVTDIDDSGLNNNSIENIENRINIICHRLEKDLIK